MEWQELSGNWVLLPRQPVGVIHALGGAFIGATPHLTYRYLLERLAARGFAIIATPFLNTFDHGELADTTLRQFELAYQRLQRLGRLRPGIPLYGLGHSMGCKLHLLINSVLGVERSGNILLAFNNYPAKRSIPGLEPLLDRIASPLQQVQERWGDRLPINLDRDVEFTPNPEETLILVERHYTVRRNLLVKFRQDTLDQTRELMPILSDRFGSLTTVLRLPGNHLTPLGQPLSWQAGDSFSIMDALGQWAKQELYRDLQHLADEICRWLQPLATPSTGKDL